MVNKDTCPSCGIKFIDHEGLTKTCDRLWKFLRNSCADDEEIKKLCYEVLPKKTVNGDNYGDPSNVDLVEILVNIIKYDRKNLVKK